MRLFTRRGRVWGLRVLGIVMVALLAWTWVIPTIVIGQIRRSYDGHVRIDGVWLGGRSSGVRGLVLHEGRSADSPVWLRVRDVETDLSLGQLLSGRFTPKSVQLAEPQVTLRLDRHGEPITRILVRNSGTEFEAALLKIREGKVQVVREGHAHPFVVGGIAARMNPASEYVELELDVEDKTWGTWRGEGRFDTSLAEGSLQLVGRGVRVDAERHGELVFLPEELWDHVLTAGPIDVDVEARVGPDPIATTISTSLRFRDLDVELPSLHLSATDASGSLEVREGIVQLEEITSTALGGQIQAQGTLDFRGEGPRFGVHLSLDGIEVDQIPPSWGLSDLQLAGTMTGEADLKAVLSDSGIDLSGSSGSAIIEGGSFQGIPVKSLRLSMRGVGKELRYETTEPATARSSRATPLSALMLSALQEVQTEESLLADPAAQKAGEEPPTEPGPPLMDSTQDTASPEGPRLRLPRSLSTEIELEDVDLALILSRVEALGIHLPFPIAGQLSLKAEATIPLGTLRQLRSYTFRGAVRLQAAHIAGVDLGDLHAALNLSDGILELTDFRGVLVEKPDGGLADHANAVDAPAIEGPLPEGGFRASLRAELEPPGLWSLRVESESLPISELAAPVLGTPTPLSGRATIWAEFAGDVTRLSEPEAWTGKGRIEAESVMHQGTLLDSANIAFQLNEGRLTIEDLRAKLQGQPLTGEGNLRLVAPHEFEAVLNVAGWSLAEIRALIPVEMADHVPLEGVLTITLSTSGTLQPRRIAATGEGTLAGFRVDSIPLGDLPFQLKTQGEVIQLEVPEARPFGGILAFGASIPRGGTAPVKASARFADVDLAQLAEAVPGANELGLAGRAEGTANLQIRPAPAPEQPPIELGLDLKAPNLTVQGLATTGVRVNAFVQDQVLHYELTAESLGGRMLLRGDVPLVDTDDGTPAARDDLKPREPQARFHFVGFSLAGLWQSLGAEGSLTQLGGLAAIDANVLGWPSPRTLRMGSVIEVRNLSWRSAPIGGVRGTLSRTPLDWKLEPLTGKVMGGSFEGWARGATTIGSPPVMEFAGAIADARLSQILAPALPELASRVDGAGSLRLNGRLDDGLRVRADVTIDQARLLGLPLAEARVPLELSYAPSGATGQLVLRDGRTRFAGGNLRANAEWRLGSQRTYRGNLRVEAVDLESLVRVLTDTRRPVAGRISGIATFGGPDPTQWERLQGRLDFDLDDASVLELPVFREISRFLGAARGGVFEDGEFHAAIANRQVLVESLSLAGRLAQIYAEGTIGFDTRLDLKVMINTNQIIPQTGQALVQLIPGLNAALNRRDFAMAQISQFLSNRLLKLHVRGTISNPQISVDPAILVTDAAVAFFGGALKLPLGFLR